MPPCGCNDSCNCGVQAADTYSIDMSASGNGSAGSPYMISGDVRLVEDGQSPLASGAPNLVKEHANGLYVAYADVLAAGGSVGGITPCLSSAKPTTGLYEGRQIWCTDTDEYLICVNPAGAGTWRKPWNVPWGWLDIKSATVDQGPFTAVTDLTGLSSTLTSIGNREWEISATCDFQSTADGDRVALEIVLNAFSFRQIKGRVTSAGPQTLSGSLYVSPAPGVSTIKLRASRATGTGNITMKSTGVLDPCQLAIKDVGPLGSAV